MTPRMPKSKFYSSRYSLFSRTHQVRIIARSKFAVKTPQSVLSPIINGIRHSFPLVTYKTPKTSDNNKVKGLTNVN
jgi:hypothetical protein